MNKGELTQFAPLMATAASVFGKDLPETVIEIYWRSLKRFSLTAIAHALQTHLEHPERGKFFPTPADIICVLKGSNTSNALAAWDKVAQAITHVGSYTSVAFDDPLIHTVIMAMGGWVTLCQTSTQQLTFSALEFQKRYQGLLIHPPKHYPKVLTGRIDAKNACHGVKHPLPTLIGDKQQAQHVMRAGNQTTRAIHPPQRGSSCTHKS